MKLPQWKSPRPGMQRHAVNVQRAGMRLLAICLALGIVLPAVPAMAASLRIGTISVDPARDIKEFQPLADYLGSRLGKQGIDSAEVVVAADVGEMAKLLQADRVDLFIDSPFPVLLTQHQAGNKVLLRRWKRGVLSYSGVIFARVDSGLTGIGQLKGKMLAFEEPFSTASYYLAKSHLIHAGLKLNRKSDSQDAVAPDEVGYLFSGDDRNTMAWVLTGKTGAGVMNDEKYKKLARGHERDLRILDTTMIVPRHLVTYRKSLGQRLVKEVRSVLMDMERSPEGLAALKAFNQTTRFDELNEADRKALHSMHRIYDAEISAEVSGRAP